MNYSVQCGEWIQWLRLRQYIKKIRKKTENANVKSGYIETVWGSGYRFRVIDSDVSGERESIVDAI
mgnify:CR=1 FL=1